MSNNKITQAMIVDSSSIGPVGQGVQLFAFYDSTGAPISLVDTDTDVDTTPPAIVPVVTTLSNSGNNVAVDASLGNAYKITLTASTWTIKNPTNPTDGQKINFRVIQDGTGSRTVTWDTAYSFGAGSAPTLTTTASKRDIVAFEYDSDLSKWLFLGSSLGF
jgi:hypothetical protein